MIIKITFALIIIFTFASCIPRVVNSVKVEDEVNSRDVQYLPPAEDPPTEDPPAEDPPAEDPPAEDPPAEDPPAEDPPAEDPPSEDPPSEDPPSEDPPSEDPPSSSDPEALYPTSLMHIESSIGTKITSNIKEDIGFGGKVSCFNNYIVSTNPNEDNGANNSGAIYVHYFTGSSWVQQAKLSASDPASNAYLGSDVAIYGNYIVVGDYQKDEVGIDSGAAYIYKKTTTGWEYSQKLMPSVLRQFSQFGYSVALNDKFLIVAARGHDSYKGRIFVYELQNGIWILSQNFSSIAANDGDYFGESIALFETTLVVGATSSHTEIVSGGAAFIFEHNGSSWSQTNKLIASDGSLGDFFGAAVDIFQDKIIVGAHGNDQYATNSGSVYIFEKSGSSWIAQTRIERSSTYAQANSFYGSSVAIRGEYALIGAFGSYANIQYPGEAYLYKKVGSSWTLVKRITSSSIGVNAGFGKDVALCSTHALISAPHDTNSSSTISGSVFIY